LGGAIVIWTVIAISGLIFSATFFGWMLYRTGRLPHPAPLITSLSMLTAIALVGAMLTGDDNVGNIAAVGFGALAGSLASVYGLKSPQVAEEGPSAKQTIATRLSDTVDELTRDTPDVVDTDPDTPTNGPQRRENAPDQ
jgi:hypothetical protein